MTVAHKTHSSWGKLIYYQLKQNWIVRHNDKNLKNTLLSPLIFQFNSHLLSCLWIWGMGTELWLVEWSVGPDLWEIHSDSYSSCISHFLSLSVSPKLALILVIISLAESGLSSKEHLYGLISIHRGKWFCLIWPVNGERRDRAAYHTVNTGTVTTCK